MSKQIKKCYKCPNLLTEDNRSKEHIIPNFLGGRLTSPELLCKKCNSEFGETIDSELKKQLGFASEIIVQKRHRDKADNGILIETTSGKKAKVGSQFLPKPKLYIKLPNGQQIEITGKNEKELRKIANKKKKELETKYESFQLTEFIEYPTTEKFHFKNNKELPIGYMEFGGKDYFRGIAKIILNFYITKRPNDKPPQVLLDYVCGRLDKNQFLFIYHPSHYKIHDLGVDEFSHIIYLRGDQELKTVYCYLELFNFEKFICIIDKDYNSQDFIETYSCDCTNGREIEKKIAIELYRHHIEDMFYVSLGHKRQRERSLHELEKRIEKLQMK